MTKNKKKIFKFIIVAILIIMLFVLIPKISLARDPDDPNFADENGIVVEDATENDTANDDESDGLMIVIKKTVAKWYYIIRYFSIICMLIVLIYLGIKLAITSIAEEQAKYKRMLYDWIVGFVIIFFIHYFMLLVLKINEGCVNFITDFSTKYTDELLLENEMGLKGAGLYETIRTRAYEFRTSIGTSGMIMYMVLVYYTVRFILIYFKRFFTILILTIIAPIAALSYAFTKVNSGKAQILGKWAQEYTYNVCLQTIHAILYACFVSLSLALSDESIVGFILALVMLNFMLKADKIFRKIFNFSGSILESNDNSDIKENMAGLIAAKAAMTNSGAKGIAKSTASSLKRGVGAITNTGLYAGLTAYSKILDNNNENLEKKQKESQDLEKDIENASSLEEKTKLKEKKDKLDKKIAQMQGRRSKLAKYKGQNISKTAVGQAINDARINKKAADAIKKEEERTGAELTKKRKEEIKAEIAKKHNDRIIRRNVEYSKQTGKKEVTSGIAKRLKLNLDTAIWGNDEIKSATKDMVKGTIKGISGAAMIAFAIPQIVSEPQIGMPLLAKGISDAKQLYGNSEYRSVTTSGYRRKIKKTIKKNKKANKEKNSYSFNRMNSTALKTVKEQIKMDNATNIIKNINTPNLSLAVLTMPLRLTGVLGAARKIQSYSYKVSEARRDYFEAIEVGFAIQIKDTLNKDFTAAYDRKVSRMEERKKDELLNETSKDMMLRHKLDTGIAFEICDKKIEFKNSSISSVTQTDLIDNIILKVAANNNISNLKNLNTDDQFVQLQIIQELSNIGLIANASQIRFDQNQPEISKLMEKVSERIEVISQENPDAVREKLTQLVIIDYMEKNGIDDPSLLETDEHREKLKEELLTRLEQVTIQEREEELSELDDKTRQEFESEEEFNLRIEEIVRNAMETATSKDEIIDIVETEIRKMLLEQQQEDDEGIVEIQGELEEKRKQHSTDSGPILIDAPILDATTDEPIIVPEKIEQQTKQIVQSVDDIIAIINKKDEEKVQTEIFIDEIISSLEIVSDDGPTISQKEQEKLDSTEVVKSILDADARREVRRSDEFKALNDELRIIAQAVVSQETPEVSDEFIGENLSGSNDELVAYLLAMKDQDKVAIDLKVKPQSSEKKKFIQIDSQTAKKTFDKINLEQILLEIKQPN